MGPRVPGRVQAPTEAKRRARRARGGFAHVLPLLSLAVVCGLLLAGCGEMQPYSTVSPRTDKADEIQGLYKILFWGALVVFVLVQAFIIYTILRWRRRNDDRPEQIHGNRRLELAWTIIPAIVLLAIFIPTAQTIYDHAGAEEDADFVIDIYGKQWWWEIHYPQVEGLAPGQPLITANEVRLPVGADVVFNLRSNNVIHSFWVPQLSGKTDVIPGHNNRLQFVASVPGEYWGECAEFCGAAHAWMRFKVIVEPRESYEAWLAAWHQPPPAAADADPATADVSDAPAAFANCLTCHNISGAKLNGTLDLNIAQWGVYSNPYSVGAGPNLTLFGCRSTIGAGIMENTRENLVTWLKDTDKVKEGVYMPNYYRGVRGAYPGAPEQAVALDDAAVETLADYLGSLVPAEGCPELQPVGGLDDTSATDTDAATGDN